MGSIADGDIVSTAAATAKACRSRREAAGGEEKPKTCGCGKHAAPVEVEAVVTPSSKPCGCKHHAAAETPAVEAAEPEPGKAACGCRRLLWIRKVHSGCGLVFGAFLLEHLAATALGLRPSLFARYMQFLQAALAEAPWLHALVFVPLAVAALFGGYLLFTAGLRFNVKKCNRGGKLRYWLQRMSAIVLLAFVGYHLLTLRDYRRLTDSAPSAGALSGAAGADSARAVFTGSVRGFQSLWPNSVGLYPLRLLVVASLLVGTWAAVYHFSNGLWSAAIAWGIVETPASQRRWEWVCLAAGVSLATLGTMGWIAFTATLGG